MDDGTVVPVSGVTALSLDREKFWDGQKGCDEVIGECIWGMLVCDSANFVSSNL